MRKSEGDYSSSGIIAVMPTLGGFTAIGIKVTVAEFNRFNGVRIIKVRKKVSLRSLGRLLHPAEAVGLIILNLM
jgi:hypothetical protein